MGKINSAFNNLAIKKISTSVMYLFESPSLGHNLF